MSILSGIGSALANIVTPTYSSARSTSYGETTGRAENWSSTSAGSSQASNNMAYTMAKLANENAAKEAQKNRDWEKMMSDTAYQRAVEDLKKAGLNPILAYYNGGSGASTPSGSTAQSFMDSYSFGSGSGGSFEQSDSYGYNNNDAYNTSKSESNSSTGIQNFGKAYAQSVVDVTEAGLSTLGLVFQGIDNSARNHMGFNKSNNNKGIGAKLNKGGSSLGKFK